MTALPTIQSKATRRVPSIWPHVVVCVLALAACTTWAVWPSPELHLPRAPIELLTPTEDTGSTRTQVAFDHSAFHAPIWVRPPAPPAEPKPTAPPPPTKLQLLALSTENGVAKAMLYDPDADRVVNVSIGDKVSRAEVEDITSDRVVIADAAGRHQLLLDPSRGGQP